MINDDTRTENIKHQNVNWLQIPDHSYRIVIIWRSWSGKTNALLNPIKQ